MKIFCYFVVYRSAARDMHWALVIPNRSNRNLVAIDCTVSTNEESVNPFFNLCSALR